VLQGARNEKDAVRLEADFRQFPVVAMGGEAIARKAAHNYRFMRQYGFTAKLPDLYIGTFCLEHGYELLHNDRDYDAFEKLLGLRVLS
jgi:predicted nucleic acid-binding protein